MNPESVTAVLEASREQGFLGPGPVERHLVHARELAVALGSFAGEFLDLGSGGGVPGIVLAMAWPASRAVLLDSQQRRCAFLLEAVLRLDLEARVSVECGRAEVLARRPDLRGRFGLVVARSFGPPAVTAECAVGFLAAGGRLAVTEPPGDTVDQLGLRWPGNGIARLGLSGATLVRRGETSGAVMTLEGAVDDRWPRREGVPGKRPLW